LYNNGELFIQGNRRAVFPEFRQAEFAALSDTSCTLGAAAFLTDDYPIRAPK
jgi:hypothetical protein